MFNKDMFRQYRNFVPGEFIICYVDTAGEGQDYNAGHFLSKTRLDIPMVLHYEGSITDVTPVLKYTLDLIKKQTGVNPVVAYETNAGGSYELERLARLNKLQSYTMYYQYKMDDTGRLMRSDKLGFSTNTATRGPMLIALQDMIKGNLVTIYDKLTVDEMFSFVKHKTPSGWRAEAEMGSHDDLIMALAGAWQLYQTENKPVNEYEDLQQYQQVTQFQL
jgi:hypothetical protein